jgi:hypothetical protein
MVSEVTAVMGGSAQVTALAVVLVAFAAGLDWIVRWMHARGFSPALCKLLHAATLAIAAIDCCLVLSYAAAHAWEARPPMLRMSIEQSVTDPGRGGQAVV